ncbi:MAG: hypothetical protein V4543_11455 [Bacteroidota bacterium]
MHVNIPLFKASERLSIGLSLLVCLFAGFVTTSCTTDVDVNAPYRETAAVYCLLNPDSLNQYARINRGFLNILNKNALDIAKNEPDSTRFKNGEIKVQLVEIGPNKSDTLGLFQPVEDNKKDTTAGEFYGPDQVLFKYTGRALRVDRSYVLKVSNPKTGFVTMAGTNLIAPFSYTLPAPTPFIDTVNYGAKKGYYLTMSPGGTTVVGVTQAGNAAVYKLDIVTHFVEYYTNGDTVRKSFIWRNSGTFGASNSTSGSSITAPVDGDFFFALLKSKVTDNPAIYRREFRNFELFVWAGGRALDNYAAVAQNYSLALGQAPTYSNFSGGLGLLSTRRSAYLSAMVSKRTVLQMNIREAGGYVHADLHDLKFQ